MKKTASQARAALRRLASPARAKVSQGFFKTGKGEYGEGDVFIGVTVPQIRALARGYLDLELGETLKLLRQGKHEERLFAVLLLVGQYQRAKKDPARRQAIFNAYLKNRAHVDNWDLVDGSCPYILGVHLEDKDRGILYKLAKSRRLWDRRLAMVSTQHFIRQRESRDALKIAALFLKDDEDLMHKASGWMLREVGRHCGLVPLRGFLKAHAHHMPRTMLRYAIEHLSEAERKSWMARA